MPIWICRTGLLSNAGWAALLDQRFAGVSGLIGTLDLDFQGVMRACAANRELRRRGLREDPPYDWSVTMSGGLSFAQACQVHDKRVALIDVSWHGGHSRGRAPALGQFARSNLDTFV